MTNPTRTDLYVYILVRQDLPLEDQIVQASHAALYAGQEFVQRNLIPNIVLIGVKDEPALRYYHLLCTGAGIEAHLFYEPDDAMGHTALATEPLAGELRKLFAHLPLWRHVA
jgi:hypothetical protein